MKKLHNVIIRVAVIMIAFVAAPRMTAQDTYFQLPIVPDSLQGLQPRVDYLIEHYWDFCDFNKAFSNRERMGESFRSYLNLMPHASARQAHKCIAKLLKTLEKRPEDLTFLANTAERHVHSDTSEIYSDELYLPFIRAVVDNKRVDKSIKARYEHQVRVLSASQVGMSAPVFDFTDRDGNRRTFAPDSAEVTLIYFFDTECSDCHLARTRLNANIPTSRYLDAGLVRVVAISAEEPDEEWREKVKNFPSTWTVGSAPDIDTVYDIKSTPSFYILDENSVIRMKNANIDTVLTIMSRL